MTKLTQNEANTDYNLRNFIEKNRIFKNDWIQQAIPNYPHIQTILNKTSKKGTGKQGFPDLIYINEVKRLLILIENKSQIKNHISKRKKQPIKYAVDGIKHYLSFFTQENLSFEDQTIQNYFKNWKFIGVAFSGDINDEYNYRLDTFIVEKNLIKNINKNEILDEEDYIAYFENIDLEKIATDISKSSSEINRLLRNIGSQKRPILLSALMICLYPKERGTDFKNSYCTWSPETIIVNIPTTISAILESENIDKSKIEVLINELAFIKKDIDLNGTNILREILT